MRARLIAYSKYKAVAETLRARAAEAGGLLVPRRRRSRHRLAAALPHRRATGSRLRSSRRCEPAPPERRAIVRERISLVAQMAVVGRAVRERGELAFEELCRGFSRSRVIVTFLAVLELSAKAAELPSGRRSTAPLTLLAAPSLAHAT